MHRLKALMVATVIALFGSMTANAAVNQMRLTYADGHTLLIDLATQSSQLPKITFTPTALTIHVPSKVEGQPETTFECSVENLGAEMPIEFLEEQTGLADVKAGNDNLVITPIDANTLLVKGADVLTPADVKVYDMAGHSVAADITATADGEITVSIAPLSTGVYLINASRTTLKVTKR